MPDSDLTLKKILKYLLEPSPTPLVFVHLLGMGRYPPCKEQGWTADIDRALTFPLTHIEHCSKFGTSLFSLDYDCCMKLTKHMKQINFSHTLTVQATKNIVLFNNISYKLLSATVLQLCVSCSFVINIILVAATCLSTSLPLFFFLNLVYQQYYSYWAFWRNCGHLQWGKSTTDFTSRQDSSQ